MATPVPVEPRAAAPAAPTVDPTASPEAPAPTEGGVELPDDLLKIPAMQALVAGQPAAFSAVLTEFQKKPEAKIIAKNKDGLTQAGFGLYRTLDGTQGVVFNQLFLSPEEVKAADQSGQLSAVAPPFDQLNASVAGAGAANPVLAEGERPTGFKAGSPAPLPTPAGGMPKPAPASVGKTLASKRANNLAPVPPTGGSAPGQGRLLQAILKPVI